MLQSTPSASSHNTSLPPCFKRWKSKRIIGEGTYGIVHHCYDLQLDQEIALKIIKIDDDHFDNQTSMEQQGQLLVEREYNSFMMVKRIECEYLINSIEFVDFRNEHFIGIVMPYYSYGDLDSFIRKYFINKGKLLSQKLACQIISELCIAVNIAHQHNLVHCDIKLSNILVKSYDEVNENIEIVLTDFGEAFETEHTKRTHRGTNEYLPPESLKTRLYNYRVDCWSIGVVLFKMLFPNSNQSIKSLITMCENNNLTSKDSDIRDDWKRDLERVLSESSTVSQNQPEYDELFYALVMGFMTYEKEMRLNTLNALEICAILNCKFMSESSINDVPKQSSGGILEMYRMFSEIPQQHTFEESLSLVLKYFHTLSNSFVNLRVRYMIGIFAVTSALKRDFNVGGLFPVFSNSEFDPIVPEILSSLFTLSKQIKKETDKYNGHILEQLMGFFNVMTGNYNQAQINLQNSVNSYFTIHTQKALLTIMQKDGISTKLADEYSKVIEKHSDAMEHPAFFFLKKGFALFHTAKTKFEKRKALEDVLHARMLSPKCLTTYLLLIQCYLEMQDLKSAKQIFSQMIAIAEPSDCLNFIASYTLVTMQEFKLAMDYAEQYLEKYSADPNVLYFVAIIYFGLKDYASTLEFVEISLALEPLLGHAHMLKITVFERLLKFQEAEEYLSYFEDLRKNTMMKGCEIPVELIPLYPDNFTRLELEFHVLQEQPENFTPLVVSQEEESNEPVLSMPLETTRHERVEPVKHESICSSSSTIIAVPKEKVLKSIKLLLQNPNIEVRVDVHESDTEQKQVLKRLNTFLQRKIPNYDERVVLRTVRDELYLTSIHQVLAHDELLALTSEQEEEYW